MIPYSMTITAQFIIVFSITLPLFFDINYLGFKYHSFNLTYLFLPAGVPLVLTPLLTILEIMSYFIRVISLSLRLAANLLSGHILLKIILYAIMDMPLLSILILPILLLEIGVGILQAYVFITLVITYYKDMIKPH